MEHDNPIFWLVFFDRVEDKVSETIVKCETVLDCKMNRDAAQLFVP